MTEAYVLDGIRTPIGRLGGTLATVRVDDLAALVLREVVDRNGGDKVLGMVDDVILGCANQAGEDNRNLARMALLLAEYPYTIPGETVNRLCASGLSAAVSAARAIRSGDGHLFVVGGAENMTRGPYVLSKPSIAFGRDSQLFDTSLGWRFPNPKMISMFGIDEMGGTAENLADMLRISREDQDFFAEASQLKASKAQRSGRFAREIVPVRIPQKRGAEVVFDEDEFIRHDTSREGLVRLRPAFRKDGEGTVTAGNSSGLNDGACALLVGSFDAAERLGIAPKARIVASSAVGVKPRIMGIGPVDASRVALAKANLRMEDMGVIELNEAFAAQALAVLRELGLQDDDSRVNPNGGAIALGHPLGMSGARLILTACHELAIRRERFALCTLCVGVGQGMAMILERVD